MIGALLCSIVGHRNGALGDTCGRCRTMVCFTCGWRVPSFSPPLCEPCFAMACRIVEVAKRGERVGAQTRFGHTVYTQGPIARRIRIEACRMARLQGADASLIGEDPYGGDAP